jgi:hypothetical protein
MTILVERQEETGNNKTAVAKTTATGKATVIATATAVALLRCCLGGEAGFSAALLTVRDGEQLRSK